MTKNAASNKSSPAAKRTPKKGAASTKASTPRKGASPARAATPKKGHPTFVAMICEAISDIEGTVSRLAIAKWIKEHYDINESTFANHLKNGLNKAEEDGKVVKVKASYKLKATKKTKEETSKKAETPSKKKVTKRKAATPKTKQAVKKRRAEKESESEEREEEEEEGSQEEATVDEGSQPESDVGLIEDITVEKPVVDESKDGEENMPAKANAVYQEDLKVKAVSENLKAKAESGSEQTQAQSSKPQPGEEAIERSGEVASVPSQSQVEPGPEAAQEQRQQASGEPSSETNETQQAIKSSGEPSCIAQEPKVSEVGTPNEEGAAEVPVLKSEEGKVATEATEQDAGAPVITSVPVVQEADGHAGAFNKSTPMPGANDPMVVETV